MFEEKLVGQLPVLLKALTMVVPSQFQAVSIFQFVTRRAKNVQIAAGGYFFIHNHLPTMRGNTLNSLMLWKEGGYSIQKSNRRG